jgi:hypothetical protein
VTIDGVSDWWLDLLTTYTLTTRDYTLQITDTHTQTNVSITLSTSRFLTTDFNTETITVSLNYTHIKSSLHRLTINWLSSKPRLAYNPSARTTRKTPFLCCCTTVALVSVAAGTCLYLLISLLLHSNGSAGYNILFSMYFRYWQACEKSATLPQRRVVTASRATPCSIQFKSPSLHVSTNVVIIRC